MGKKSFDFFIYSNLFIAGCALLMIHQTSHFLLGIKPNGYFLLFVLFSTICSYSFHWWLSKPSLLSSPRNDWMKKYRIVHVILFFIGLAGSVLLFFYLLEWWWGLAISAIMTFLYSAPKIPHPLFRSLRKVALGKTIFLALVWMNVTTVLPIIISGQPWRDEFLLFILSRFFLIYAICILFDYRDREDDKAEGVRSLITYLDEKGIFLLFSFSLLVFFISTALLFKYDHNILSICILLLPGLITASLYRYAKTNLSDLFYYFTLDGLMALSSLLMLIPGIL
jgi:4-hydroxybenzoate polyprenyltransferase